MGKEDRRRGGRNPFFSRSEEMDKERAEQGWIGGRADGVGGIDDCVGRIGVGGIAFPMPMIGVGGIDFS